VGLDARRFKQREHDALTLIGLELEDLAVQVDEPAPQRLNHEGHTFAGDSNGIRPGPHYYHVMVLRRRDEVAPPL